MKRDKALIQKILKAIEVSPRRLQSQDFAQLAGRYTSEVLNFHLGLLCEANLIKGIEVTSEPDGSVAIDWTGGVQLTWQGFEFLDALEARTTAPTRGEAALDRHANEPERVLWEGRPDWGYYTGTWVGAILFIWTVVIPIAALIGVPIDRSTRRFTLTNRRVKSKFGLFNQKTNEVLLQDIRLLNLNQGFFERISNLGTIEIGSAGTGAIEVQLIGIKEAKRVRDLIDRHRNPSESDGRAL